MESIRAEQEYLGVRVTLRARIGNPRITVQANIGFDDAFSIEPEDIEFPVGLSAGLATEPTKQAHCKAFWLKVMRTSPTPNSREEALEAAGEALADLAGPLQELDSIAEYIPSTEADVARRWAADLKRLATLPQSQFRKALDLLLMVAQHHCGQGRLSFGDGSQPAPFPSALIVCGLSPETAPLLRAAIPEAWSP